MFSQMSRGPEERIIYQVTRENIIVSELMESKLDDERQIMRELKRRRDLRD